MKIKIWRLALPAVILILLVLFAIHHQSPPPHLCREAYRTDRVIHVAHTLIAAEIAMTPAQAEKGLGGRSCINANQGMLFVFNQPGQYKFWMKNMHFPIDIVWIGSDRRVVQIQSEVTPATYPHAFVNTRPAQYVLEMQAKHAAAIGLKPGTQLSF